MPIVGVIENMSPFVAKHGDRQAIFGSGGGRELADDLGVPLLGQIPLDPAVVTGGDSGAPVVRSNTESTAATEIRRIAIELIRHLPPVEDDTCTSRMAILADQLAELG